MKNQKLFLVTIPRYSLIVVILSLALAMVFYMSGNQLSSGYSFTRDFFSDLGRYTPGNFISFTFFVTALTACGVTLNLYFFYFMKLFEGKSLYKILAKIGCVAGMIGGLSFIGVGFAPTNTAQVAHEFFENWAFRSFLIASIFLSIVLFNDDRFSKKYSFGYALFALMIFGYVLTLEFGPSPSESDFARVFNVVCQKIIVLVFILSILFQSFGNMKIISKNN